MLAVIDLYWVGFTCTGLYEGRLRRGGGFDFMLLNSGVAGFIRGQGCELEAGCAAPTGLGGFLRGMATNMALLRSLEVVVGGLI